MGRIFLLLAGLALTASAIPVEGDPSGPGAPRETKDRLSVETLAAMVTGPLRAAVAGDLPRAERAFERLIERARRRRDGKAGVREADLLTAFGTELYNQGSDLDREDMRQLSRLYVERAVGATKNAFGPNHPETALALHSYADLLFELHKDDPPAQAETALAEAYSIRRATLGAANVETLAAMRGLARIKAARFRTSGSLDEAIALFRRAIEISARSAPDRDYLKPSGLRLGLVRAYANAGRVEDALREARIAAEEAAREQTGLAEPEMLCTFTGFEAMAIADILAVDRPAEAETLRRLFSPRDACLDEVIDAFEKEAATER